MVRGGEAMRMEDAEKKEALGKYSCGFLHVFASLTEPMHFLCAKMCKRTTHIVPNQMQKK
jgi:hypothetical protein